ncbi:MAG: hypothetical protein M1118_10420 [Chloroflexi bacterium]|nr:hypothetical protein [Chloroflexota bacterium]
MISGIILLNSFAINVKISLSMPIRLLKTTVAGPVVGAALAAAAVLAVVVDDVATKAALAAVEDDVVAAVLAVVTSDVAVCVVAVAPPQAASSEVVAVLAARPSQMFRKLRRVTIIDPFGNTTTRLAVIRWSVLCSAGNYRDRIDAVRYHRYTRTRSILYNARHAGFSASHRDVL